MIIDMERIFPGVRGTGALLGETVAVHRDAHCVADQSRWDVEVGSDDRLRCFAIDARKEDGCVVFGAGRAL